MWSILVGVTAMDLRWHNLCIHKFRVAASGRVLGHSNGLLQPFKHVTPNDDEAEAFSSASTDLSNDGRKLHLFCNVDRLNSGPDLLYRAFTLDLSDKTLSPLGELPILSGEHHPITAGCRDWALSTMRSSRDTSRLLMHRLDGKHWVEVASLEFPHKLSCRPTSKLVSIFQGFVVIGDKILVSVLDDMFFCFDCSDCSWRQVSLTGESSRYIPIFCKAVYVEEDDTIYFFHSMTLYAYKYSLEEQALAPPIRLNTLFPFDADVGSGFLVHLVARALCVVWICMNYLCECCARHVLITTLNVKGDRDAAGRFIPTGVDILHSTCRMLDMLGSTAAQSPLNYFTFIQSYVEDTKEVIPPSLPPVVGEVTYSEIQDSDSPNIPLCCRWYLEDIRDPDNIALQECKIPTKADLYFVSQVAYHSLLYKISISDGKLKCHDETLKTLCRLDTFRPRNAQIDDSPSWHFIHLGSKLYVIPSLPRFNLYVVDVDSMFYDVAQTKRPAMCFSAVLLVGHQIIGLGDTLQAVFILNHQTLTWVSQKTLSRSLDLTRKISISGFADLNDTSFIVSDAESFDNFMFDLKRMEWAVVGTHREFRFGMLSGRSIFVDGFIYTPMDEGLVAFEFIKEHDSYYLDPIFLNIHWRMLNSKFTCFASVCKDDITDCIVFCVVHGSHSPSAFTNVHEVKMTTVQVMVRETEKGRKEPMKVEHVDISTPIIKHKGWIHTSYAFAP